MDSLSLILIILGTPLLSAAIIALFFRRSHNIATALSVAASATIAFCSYKFLASWDGKPLKKAVSWFDLGGVSFDMGIWFNGDTAIMLAVVAFVGFLIHVFSMGYMNDDGARARYFGGLSIFMFSMLGIVFADNLIMLFIFWELVGFSSYALIAHYNDTPYAAMASKKAFIVNRVGDFGLLVGIIWTFWAYGTVDLPVLAEKFAQDASLQSSAIALLLMCGFLGKSAQFPLHVWLPDAMAGPTPVSALIHAATMVAAGIYFIVRVYFMFTPEALQVVLWLGAGMTAFAGLCALGQTDIKKILAYSTLSQLGYMATALGLGYPGLALFHLTTHACFKALLFLGSGSVIHAAHHEQDIFKMGGLFRKMPITAITFFVGMIALSGVTYTSGFFSKDAIIEASYLTDVKVFWLIFFSAFLTALYMGRLFWIAFLGKPRSHKAEEAHESSWVMTLPLIILAVLSLTVGFHEFWPTAWVPTLSPELNAIHEGIHADHAKGMMMLLGIGAWVLGFGLSYLFYSPSIKKDTLQVSFPLVYKVFEKKFWFDELYDGYVKSIQQRFASFMNFFDLVVIQGLFVRGVAGVVGAFALVARSFQVGSIHGYVYWFFIGLVVFAGFAIGWF